MHCRHLSTFRSLVAIYVILLPTGSDHSAYPAAKAFVYLIDGDSISLYINFYVPIAVGIATYHYAIASDDRKRYRPQTINVIGRMSTAHKSAARRKNIKGIPYRLLQMTS